MNAPGCARTTLCHLRGRWSPRLESYKEVGNGICFSQNGEFKDSDPTISILPDGSGAATNTPCKFYCPADIYDGVITFVTADGLKLESEPIGLWYTDDTNTCQIAWLTNSIGEQISSNVVLYAHAFVGGIDGDIVLTFRDSGLEQDLVIRSQPLATPQQLGLGADSKLQLVTEFVDPPTPIQSAGPIDQQDGLRDTTLSFGSMRMIQGRAFELGYTNGQAIQTQTRVYKTWATTPDQRTLLIEQVPWQRVSADLGALPRSASRTALPRKSPALRLASYHLPPRRMVKVAPNARRLARAETKQYRGLDLDYVTVDSPETNFTFCGDTTYYIGASESSFYLYGTTTIEPGSVLKFSSGNGQLGLLIVDQNGAINCQTQPWMPAVFTSMNDNSVGAEISGSSGSPVFEYNLWCLQINGTNAALHDLRFCYPWIAIGQPGTVAATTISITNCQFINCDSAVYAYSGNLYNVLIGRATNEDAALLMEGPSIVCENVTADGGAGFIEADYPGASVALTNCLVTGQPLITNSTPALATNAVAWIPSPSLAVYQTVGGGSYYLATNSPYRANGTANIAPALLKDLSQKTTWPPIVYDGTNISLLGTLGPVVPRDTNSSPDLGYHYNCLDYVFGGCSLTNSLTFTNGPAVGWFEDGSDPNYGQPYAISLNGGANLSFIGNAMQPCVFTRYPMVQEAENGNWTGDGWMGALVFNGGSPEPLLSANFTKMTSDFWSGNLFRDAWASGAGSFKNCEFYTFNISTYDVTSLIFTNCLFYRFNQSCWTSPNVTFENCTFYNGGIYLGRFSPVTWSIENCIFDGTAFDWSDSYNGTSYTTIDYNAYNTNNLSWQTDSYISPQYGTNEVVGPHDILTTNYNWQASWFGNFYIPADSLLITNGSTNANLLGLYHFTTQTNQTIDGTNIVTIGYHYVATDTNGVPLDSNGDGIPDYIEDPLGNGLPFNGTNWALAILAGITNETVAQGGTCTFSLTADGVQPLAYGWFWNGNHKASLGDQSTCTRFNVQSNYTGAYSVVVSNAFGTMTSGPVLLTVLVPPSISVEPTPYDLAVVGTNITFSVVAGGDTPLAYQWQQNGTNLVDSGNISGSQTSTLAIANLTPSDAGSYEVVITNAYGMVESTPANLWVFSPENIIDWGFDTIGDGWFWTHSPLPWNVSSNAVAISAGLYYTLTLQGNGSVQVWYGLNMDGYNGYGGVDLMPPNCTNTVAIAAGTYHCLALQDNGTVISWGADSETNYGTVPAALTNVTAVAAGTDFSLAISNGFVVAWGENSSGQTDVPSNLSNVVAIAAGTAHALALQANGTIIAWGDNTYGETNVPTALSNVMAIAAGYYDSLAVLSNGTVVAWGRDLDGDIDVPTGLTNVIAVASSGDPNLGSAFSMALKSDGSVVYWGTNSSTAGVVPPGLVASQISAGGLHAVALGNYVTCYSNILTANGLSPNAMELQWPYLSGARTEIERKIFGANTVYQEIGTVTNTDSFLDTAVYCTNQYSYRARESLSSDNWSGYSPEISPPHVVLSPSAVPGSITLNQVTYTLLSSNIALSAVASSGYSLIAQFIISNSAVGSISSSNYVGGYLFYACGNCPPVTQSQAPAYVTWETQATNTSSWTPVVQGPSYLSAFATDENGNSWCSPPISVYAVPYMDATGDGTNNIALILSGNSPVNPWIPPSGDTNSAAPTINLLVPANAQSH